MRPNGGRDSPKERLIGQQSPEMEGGRGDCHFIGGVADKIRSDRGSVVSGETSAEPQASLSESPHKIVHRTKTREVQIAPESKADLVADRHILDSPKILDIASFVILPLKNADRCYQQVDVVKRAKLH